MGEKITTHMRFFAFLLFLLFAGQSAFAQTYGWKDILDSSNNLSALNDITYTTPATNDILAWDGSNWVVSQTTVATGDTTTTTCLENDNCSGTPISCAALTPDTNTTVTSPPYTIAYGSWSNTQCGISGTGWHIAGTGISSCGTGSGTKYARCTSVTVERETVSAASDLSDVDTTGAATNDILAFDGTNWVVSQTTVATGSTINEVNDIGDVTITSANTGDLLTWNGTAWVNQTVTDTVSTTTMVSGFPDALLCSGTVGTAIFYRHRQNATHHIYESEGGTNSDYAEIRFANDGSYSSTSNSSFGSSSYYSDCLSKSISTLYTDGQALNFIGNNGASTNLNEIGDVSTTGATTNDILAFDGTNWVVSQTTVAAGSDNFGNHIATQAVDMGGFSITNVATLSATTIAGTLKPESLSGAEPISISTSVTDEVGTLTSGKWCTSDGSVVNCTSDDPTTTRADLSIDTTDDVTFGTTTATSLTATSAVTTAQLKVTGTSNTSGDSCASGQDGSIFYNSTTKQFIVCTQD